MELIAVVMKCNAAEHYTDTAALFDYGFENFESVKLASAADHTGTIMVTEEYKNKKAILTVKGADHGLCYLVDKEGYLKTIREFEKK